MKYRRLIGAFAAMFIAAAGSFCQNQANSRPQRRVRPSMYRRVPPRIRTALNRRHCELPEVQSSGKPINVFSGRFSDVQQTDWAAACITPDGSLLVLLFWGKTAACPAEISTGAEFEQRFAPGEAGDLYVAPASAKDILAYRKFFGDSHDNPVTHSGIEVGDTHASMIYYCYGGVWLELQGAD